MDLEHIVIENIKKIRKEKNISQEKLAEFCGTSTSYIGLMETYKNIPKLSTIEKIATALNVPPQNLFITDKNNQEEKISESKEIVRENIKKDLMREIEQKIDYLLKIL